MSAKATFWAWKQEVTPTEKLVLLSLANFANDECKCWYSYQKIADATGVSRRTVIRACNELQDKRLLNVVNRKKDTAQNHTNIFTLLINLDGDTVSLGVVTQCHQGSDTVSPKSNKEPNNKDLKTNSRCHDVFCAEIVNHMIDAYTQAFPNRPRPRDFVKDKARMQNAKNIWIYGCNLTKSDGVTPIYAGSDGDVTQEAGVQFWRKYFAYCAKSEFLLTQMKAFNFDWAIKKANFNKIREGNYHG